MPAATLLCYSLGVNPNVLSKEEALVLEADLFLYVCEELKGIYKNQYKEYFRTLKINTVMENTIMEKSLARCVVNDILATEEYSLPGLAYYAQTSEDVIFEIASGLNTDPASSVMRKIIELHRSIRPNLYREIMKKIISENLSH